MIRLTVRVPPLVVQRLVAIVNMQLAHMNMRHARENGDDEAVLAHQRRRAECAARIAILTLEIVK